MPDLSIFIGYDSREQLSYKVTKWSIDHRSWGAVRTFKLEHRALRRRGLFSRSWTVASSGQYIDQRDDLPFSTEFSYTRFLVPHLAREANLGRYVAFVDGDFLFEEDPREMLNAVRGGLNPVYVVKHSYGGEESHKMDGMAQSSYPMKLWSSLMLFDMDHSYLRDLTPDKVNMLPGSALHQFKWLPSSSDVGTLDPRWNVLTHVPYEGPIGALHYTLGTPEFPEHKGCRFNERWFAALKQLGEKVDY